MKKTACGVQLKGGLAVKTATVSSYVCTSWLLDIYAGNFRVLRGHSAKPVKFISPAYSPPASERAWTLLLRHLWRWTQEAALQNAGIPHNREYVCSSLSASGPIIVAVSEVRTYLLSLKSATWQGDGTINIYRLPLDSE